jgi:hypothetical protein
VSHKSTEDKEREGYPFTARQKRRKLGGRVARKAARIKISRPKKVYRKAPRRKA